MTTEQKAAVVMKEFQTITIGHTKVVRDEVVTRWSADRYEVGTWGRKQFNAHDVALCIVIPR